jgi:pimeloyl-ACP methyl ester carboxylesterase
MGPTSSRRIALASGDSLAADVVAAARPDAATFVYCHGLGSIRGGEKALFLERELARRGFGFVRFDFRGHGDSTGKFEELTLTRQLEDLRAVVADVESRTHGATDATRVVLIGASLGALTAAWFSALEPRRVAAQVLIAPAFKIVERYLDALGEFGRARWQREGTYRFVGPWFEFDLRWDVVTDGERHPFQSLVERTRVPTLVIHGTKDASAPFRLSEEFVRDVVAARATHSARDRSTPPRAPIRLVAIEGGDHRLTDAKPRLLDEIVRFTAEGSTCVA